MFHFGKRDTSGASTKSSVTKAESLKVSVETTSLISSKLKERLKISKAKIGIKNILRVRNPGSLNKSEDFDATAEKSSPGLKPTSTHPFLELPEKIGKLVISVIIQ
jgi:hypothetical protein